MAVKIKSNQKYYSQNFNHLSMVEQKIEGVEFEDCSFTECDFTEATFRKCRFIECVFSDCNLSVMKIGQSQFTDVSFEQCKLIGVNWTRAMWSQLRLAASLSFKNCVMNDSSFFDINLDELNLTECKAHDVDFRNGSFSHANFTHTDFTGSLFGKTDLSGADFTEAVNYDIDIFDNKIDKAKFTRYEAVRLLNCLDVELLD